MVDAVKPLLLTRKQVAVRLGVCERFVTNLVRRGALNPIQLGSRKATRYRIREVDALAGEGGDDAGAPTR